MTTLDLTTDVLVVGGGPAATWAALKAARAGADVVLADKGYCGTSGATASAGTGVWYVPPEPATRELICGGFTGGGSHNAAWAISSGGWAGQAAARHARSLSGGARTRRTVPVGGAGLRPTGTPGPADGFREVVAAVQGEVLPYRKNYLRHGDGLAASLRALDDIWHRLRATLYAGDGDAVRARQAAAMVAHARWMYTAALARTETRGMAKRLDFPAQDPGQHHRIVTGGLDRVWTRPEPLTTAPREVA
ncbi:MULTISPECIES: FAD-binding protein [Streptomyces]|uniref:FAD-binding protein n=1 Tax=Streptomyces lycopersici TaxID=2974589 RepID=UPI0021D3C6BA|nr:FAD-binding protein [Streptomyces sp. NEAU-383]